MLAKHPASLEVNLNDLSMMYYTCAHDEPGSVFQVFPTKDVAERAAVTCLRAEREGLDNDFCVTALLTKEEEGSVYEAILIETLQRILKSDIAPSRRLRRYKAILADSYRKIERRGGSRDQSLCPYMYERPMTNDDLTSFCRVVKKQCYLTCYDMPGYPQCPRYVRRQRQIQIENARRLVRAGIQRILEEHDQQRQKDASTKPGAWAEPVHTILDRLFAVLDLSPETETYAHKIIDQVGKEGLFQGHPRPIIAASIAYYSAKHTGDSLPENDIIELVGCSRTSLRRNYRELRMLLNSEATTQPKQRRRPKQKHTPVTRAE
ncbi:MAG: cyclin family protein [Candidatus Hodarchaeota archaeon]